VTHTADSVRPAPDRSPPAEHPPSAGGLRQRHRVPLLVTLAALPPYAVWWALLATGGGDLAAQETWAHFAARHPGSPYMLSWFGGAHVANYSVLSPYLMGAFGVRTVTVVSGLAATWLTAALVVRTGIRRPLGPALLAALMLWCNVQAGRSTFALGVAFALAACLILTGTRRVGLLAAYAALATLASPVAGLFLAVVGAAFLAVRDWGRALSLLVPPAAVVAATTLLFPFSGQQPMPFPRLMPPLLMGLAVTVLAPRTWRVVRWAGAVYATVCVLVYLIPSPIGTNVERFAWLFAAPVLLAALMSAPVRARRRRVVLITAVVCSTAWIVPKSVLDLRFTAPVPAWAADTHGVVRALEALGADRTRVELVPTGTMREAALLSPHVNLARGWNQHIDMKRHRLFYDGTFSASTYRAWLDRWAVGFVVLPSAEPWHYAKAEAALIRDHRPEWLRPVWHDAHWQVYRVQNPVPLVSSPATVTRTTPAEMDIRMPRSGTVTLRIAYSPWLHSDGGCLTRDGEFTRLTVSALGLYHIGSQYSPSPSSGSC
jgi:hypothetical protein